MKGMPSYGELFLIGLILVAAATAAEWLCGVLRGAN